MAGHPAPVLALVSDFVFATKIRSTALAVGATVEFVPPGVPLDPLLASVRPTLFIVDLNDPGGRAVEAITAAKSGPGGPRILAFVSHVDQELARKGREAGADEVMPRSKFVRILPDVLHDAAGAQ